MILFAHLTEKLTSVVLRQQKAVFHQILVQRLKFGQVSKNFAELVDSNDPITIRISTTQNLRARSHAHACMYVPVRMHDSNTEGITRSPTVPFTTSPRWKSYQIPPRTHSHAHAPWPRNNPSRFQRGSVGAVPYWSQFRASPPTTQDVRWGSASPKSSARRAGGLWRCASPACEGRCTARASTQRSTFVCMCVCVCVCARSRVRVRYGRNAVQCSNSSHNDASAMRHATMS